MNERLANFSLRALLVWVGAFSASLAMLTFACKNPESLLTCAWAVPGATLLGASLTAPLGLSKRRKGIRSPAILGGVVAFALASTFLAILVLTSWLMSKMFP